MAETSVNLRYYQGKQLPAKRSLKFELQVGRNQSQILKIVKNCSAEKVMCAPEHSIFMAQQKKWYLCDRMSPLIAPD